MGLETPVVLFTFNRPDTTRDVFEAIRAVRPKTLLVVGDGPRADRPGEAELVAETRAILAGVDWPCDLHTNLSAENLGVPARFASAFEWIFDRVDEAIILEHDCLPHPTFFAYCEELLQRYRDDPGVMWIGGTNPSDEHYGDGSYFFARSIWVWGWATWRRAWQHYDLSVRDLPRFQQSKMIERISPYRRLQNGYMAIFERAHDGEWNNWDAQATFTVWSNDGVAVVPNGNLVTNIGFDELATNTTRADDPLARLPFRPIDQVVHPSDRTIRVDYDIRMYDEHASWMNDYARARRLRRIRPLVLYNIAGAAYELFDRFVAALPFT